MTTPTIRVAAVQAEPIWLDKEATTAKTVELIAEAAAGGADLVAFPETWIPGYPVFLWSYPVYQQAEFVRRYHENSPTIDGPEVEAIRQAARQNGVSVVVGLSERDHGSLYMSQLIIGSDGELVLHRRKLKPTHAERSLFGEGDGGGLCVVDMPFGRLGALNCFEHLQPLSKYAMYAQNEEIHVAGWPCLGILGMVPLLAPEAILATTLVYAMESGSFVVMSTQIMSDEGARRFPSDDGGPTPVYTGGGGYARIYGPDTTLRTTPLDPAVEGIVYADIDLGEIASAKNILDPAGHYARPDATQLLFHPEPRRPVEIARPAGQGPEQSSPVPDDNQDEAETTDAA